MQFNQETMMQAKWFGQINDEWRAGKYYQAGFDGANYSHTILRSPSLRAVAD